MFRSQIYPYPVVSKLDRVTAYAYEVISGRIIAGKTQRQACERHVRDLKHQGTKEFPFVFDPCKAHEIIEFAETLTLAEGDEPQPLRLWGFQDFILGNWGGWLNAKGYRRFRTSYVQLARQNGKSLKNAVPALYYGNFDSYQYPQVYCAATKELQARIVLSECIKFINADPELSGGEYGEGLFKVKEYAGKVECAVSNGTKKLKQCLISVITTAGFDLNSPCYRLYEYCKLILSDLHLDETQFAFICELDEQDDIWDEKNWPKANPLWTEETLESLHSEAVKAKEMQGEDLRNFLTKSLNQWVQFTDNQYMNLSHWKACESDITIEDMKEHECYLGLDLSSGGDPDIRLLGVPYRRWAASKILHSFTQFHARSSGSGAYQNR